MPRESLAECLSTPPRRRRAAPPKTKDINVDPVKAAELERLAEEAGKRDAGEPIPIGRGRPQTSADVRTKTTRKKRGRKTGGDAVPVATARQRENGPGEHLIVTRKGKTRRRRTVYMSPDVDAQLVGYCEAEGREASIVISMAVERYLASLDV